MTQPTSRRPRAVFSKFGIGVQEWQTHGVHQTGVAQLRGAARSSGGRRRPQRKPAPPPVGFLCPAAAHWAAAASPRPERVAAHRGLGGRQHRRLRCQPPHEGLVAGVHRGPLPGRALTHQCSRVIAFCLHCPDALPYLGCNPKMSKLYQCFFLALPKFVLFAKFLPRCAFCRIFFPSLAPPPVDELSHLKGGWTVRIFFVTAGAKKIGENESKIACLF